MLGNQLWVKKYRPDTLDGYVFKDNTFKKQMENWINKKDESGIPIPNLLFVGKPGSGKTTAAKILINCLGVQKMDVLEINASRENNVETIRNKVQNFCAGYPFGRYKIVLMEECLEENEEIYMADGSSKKLKDFEIGKQYKILNVNMETQDIEEDIGEVLRIDENKELYEVELEDGRTITTTFDHPFLIKDSNGKIIEKELKYLKEGDKIISKSQKGKIEETSIKKITKVNNGTVRVFTAHKNHTIMTKNGIVTHNCDGLTGIAQGILRAEIERFEETVRFIGTANYKNKFIPAILSRFQVFDFLTLDLDSYFYRITEILDKENVEYSEEDVVEFVDSSFPDLRSGINLIQQHVVDNKLQKLVANTEGNSEYLIEAVELFKKGDYKKARNIICSRAVPDDYPEIYRYFYKNLQLFSDDIYNQDKALIIIKNGMIYHSTAIDPEINLAATIAELSKVNE